MIALLAKGAARLRFQLEQQAADQDLHNQWLNHSDFSNFLFSKLTLF
jgi:hypothetical protein